MKLIQTKANVVLLRSGYSTVHPTRHSCIFTTSPGNPIPNHSKLTITSYTQLVNHVESKKCEEKHYAEKLQICTIKRASNNNYAPINAVSMNHVMALLRISDVATESNNGKLSKCICESSHMDMLLGSGLGLLNSEKYFCITFNISH